jgi:hypothetical protein
MAPGPVFDNFLGPAGSPQTMPYGTTTSVLTRKTGFRPTPTRRTTSGWMDKAILLFQALRTPSGYTSARLVTPGKPTMLYEG